MLVRMLSVWLSEPILMVVHSAVRWFVLHVHDLRYLVLFLHYWFGRSHLSVRSSLLVGNKALFDVLKLFF